MLVLYCILPSCHSEMASNKALPRGFIRGLHTSKVHLRGLLCLLYPYQSAQADFAPT
jgi:hypothetical protein